MLARDINTGIKDQVVGRQDDRRGSCGEDQPWNSICGYESLSHAAGSFSGSITSRASHAARIPEKIIVGMWKLVPAPRVHGSQSTTESIKYLSYVIVCLNTSCSIECRRYLFYYSHVRSLSNEGPSLLLKTISRSVPRVTLRLLSLEEE